MATIIEETVIDYECIKSYATRALDYARMCEHLCTEILEKLGAIEMK